MSMRNPNGYGSISKLSGNRRNKYVIRKTVGVELDHEKGKAKYKQQIIGYSKTKKEAQQKLAEFNANPYDVSAAKTTFAEVYEKVYAEKEGIVTESTLKSYVYAYNNCTSLHNRIFAELRLQDLQDLVDNCGKNFPTLKKLKVLWQLMYTYAMKYDLVSKDYAQYVNLDAHKLKHEVKLEDEKHLTHDEVKQLWQLKDDEFCQTILALMWTGLRINEFLELKNENVHLEEHYFVIPKGKTLNATRKVPIADAIYPFFEKWYGDGKDTYLLKMGRSQGDKPVNYDYYRTNFMKLMDNLDWPYTIHATRHTFTSLLADLDVSPTIRSKLAGHSQGNVTETVYTHLDVNVLLDAVNKLECFID